MKVSHPGLKERAVVPRLTHLLRLTGEFGLYEHAHLDEPRVAHGYTTDDNARALVVLTRIGGDACRMIAPYRRFVLAAAGPDGFHNRLGPEGRWRDRIGSDDSQGRALWGLAHIAERDQEAADAIALWRSLTTRHPRANAYATLGMCELARRVPDYPQIEAALERFARALPRPVPDREWPWPEPRLTYGNARIPQALLEAGMVMDDAKMVADGLDLLAWLVEIESGDIGFSFTPVRGRGPGSHSPEFDQQPIEAWAMADACHSARAIDRAFETAFEDAVLWFLGRNDTGAILYERETGAGFDGLSRVGVNLNRGAESTLSALGVLASIDTPAEPTCE